LFAALRRLFFQQAAERKLIVLFPVLPAMVVRAKFLTRQPLQNSQLLPAMQTPHSRIIVFFVSRLKGIPALF
jgi:hypothetical protein